MPTIRTQPGFVALTLAVLAIALPSPRPGLASALC